MDPTSADALNRGAHIVQLALTPVFLLSAIAALLNVFSARLARVADQVDRVTRELEDPRTPDRPMRLRLLRRLSRRSMAMDVAVVLGTLAGVATSGAALTLFLGAFRERGPVWALYVSFGAALVCTVGALTAYMAEMLMASQSLRREARTQDTTAG